LDFTRVDAPSSGTLDRMAARGIEAYERQRHLPRLLPIPADDLVDVSPAAQRSILRRLARALRAERNRGRAGHWTYDLNRHIALAQAYAAERRHLAAVRILE
jgi:hypothetical protein